MRVSIIIPVYNTENYLRRCIESCLHQSFEDIEILIINDGSTDGSKKIIDDIAKTDLRIRVFHQLNAGVVRARRVGIDNAKTEWIMFVDSDDVIDSNAVELLWNRQIEHHADFVVGLMQYCRNGKKYNVISECKYGETEYERCLNILGGHTIGSLCGKLIQRELLNGVLSPDDIKIGEDTYLTSQIVCKAKKVSVVNQPIYFYISRSNSVIQKPSDEAVKSIVKFLQLLEDYFNGKPFSQQPEYQKALANYILPLYFSYLKWGGTIKDSIELFNRVCKEYIPLYDRNLEILEIWKYSILKIYKYSPFTGRWIMKTLLNVKIILNFIAFKSGN